MANDRKNKKKNIDNKGVCCTSDTIEVESLPSKISDDTEPHSPKSISVSNVREELRNVIETMGPDTNSIIPDSETEDTTRTTYSTVGHSYITNEEFKSEKDTTCHNIILTDDESIMTNYNVSELVEYPPRTIDTSMQTSNREYICPNVNFNNIPVPTHNFCPQYNMMQNEYLSHGHTLTNVIPQNDSKHISFGHISRIASWMRLRNKPECKNCSKNCDLYKINIDQNNDDHSPPRRLVFDLMEELPKADTKTIGTNTKKDAFGMYKPPNNINVKINKCPGKGKEQITERVDIYYFDHGNAEYYRTTDSPPMIKTEYLAERTDYYTKKFWAELFGSVHIGVSFVISFILQFLRFILQSIFRPLTIGIIQLISDYFFKPGLAVIFNGIVQPPMIFLYNIMTSVRDVCAPIADTIGYFIREISVMFKAIRLVQVDQGKCGVKSNPGKNCGTE